MTYNFEYHDVTASEALESYTQKKLEKLAVKYDFLVRADIFFKTENTSDDQTGMKAGIRLSAPGPRIFAESSKETFHEAVNDVVRELNSQLKRRKDQMKPY